MNHRFLVSVKTVLGVIAVGLLATGPLVAQAPDPAPADGYTLPRTPDGQPDLQGFWTNATYTPLERPDGVTREF